MATKPINSMRTVRRERRFQVFGLRTVALLPRLRGNAQGGAESAHDSSDAAAWGALRSGRLVTRLRPVRLLS